MGPSKRKNSFLYSTVLYSAVCTVLAARTFPRGASSVDPSPRDRPRRRLRTVRLLRCTVPMGLSSAVLHCTVATVQARTVAPRCFAFFNSASALRVRVSTRPIPSRLPPRRHRFAPPPRSNLPRTPRGTPLCFSPRRLPPMPRSNPLCSSPRNAAIHSTTHASCGPPPRSVHHILYRTVPLVPYLTARAATARFCHCPATLPYNKVTLPAGSILK